MSLKTVKNGSGDYGQRYLCRDCQRRFRLKDFVYEKFKEELWNDFVFGKQTLRELSDNGEYSKSQLKRIFESILIPEKIHKPKPIHLVVDATFFGKKETRLWGVVVFRDFYGKENLWWKFVDQEKATDYIEGKMILESLGYTILSVTMDGLPGLASVFNEFPIQFCHFHQTQIIRRYVTENPKLIQGHELLGLVKVLTFTEEYVFTHRLQLFISRHRNFLNEKTTDILTGKSFYTHPRLRSAIYSLIRNLPNLFTFQKYPNLKIPTTTNCLESHFSHIKDIVRIHRGLSLSQKQKMIHYILLNSSIVLKPERKQ